MFISLNWIKEFVDLDGIDIKELEKRFTLATAEIEGIEEKGKNIKNVFAGKILSVEEKPDLKTTRVVKVDIGDGKEHQTCCGAPNAEAVIFAGTVVLSISVLSILITAPLSSLTMNFTYNALLEEDNNNN